MISSSNIDDCNSSKLGATCKCHTSTELLHDGAAVTALPYITYSDVACVQASQLLPDRLDTPVPWQHIVLVLAALLQRVWSVAVVLIMMFTS